MVAELFDHFCFKGFVKALPGNGQEVCFRVGNKLFGRAFCVWKIADINQIFWNDFCRCVEQKDSILRQKAIIIHLIVDFGFFGNIFLGTSHINRPKAVFISCKIRLHIFQSIQFFSGRGKFAVLGYSYVYNWYDMPGIPNAFINLLNQKVLSEKSFFTGKIAF